MGTLLIACGIPLYRVIRQRYGNQALIAAIRTGDRNAVRDWLASGADPNARIPLAYVDTSPRAQFMRLFQRSVANDTTEVPFDAPALCAGIEQIHGTDVFDVAPEDPMITEMLLRYGADINKTDYYGQTALGWAVSLNRTQTVRMLLEHGANPDGWMKFTNGWKIAMSGKRERVLFEARHGDEVQYRESLFQASLDVPWAGDAVTSPEIVRLLILHGVDEHTEERYRLTPLMIASLKGDKMAVQALLKGGGDVNMRVRGYTALGWITACTPRFADQEIERLLVRAGGVK